MTKSRSIFLMLPLFLLLGQKASFSVEEENSVLSIGGVVQSPMQLSLPDLNKFRQTTIAAQGETGAKGNASARYVAVPLRSLQKEGRIIGLLEPGDPTLYGGWRNWLSEYIPQDQIKIIPGMSSFSVANAILGEFDLTDNPLVIVEPEDLKANDGLLQASAQNGHTLVVFMGLNRMKSLVPLLSRHFPPATPLFVVYYAGIAGKEYKLQTTLSQAIEATDSAKENFLGLIYVGRELKIPSSAPR